MLPINYRINGEKNVERPIGKKAKILEVEGIMVSTPKKNIYSVMSLGNN